MKDTNWASTGIESRRGVAWEQTVLDSFTPTDGNEDPEQHQAEQRQLKELIRAVAEERHNRNHSIL